MCLTHSEAKNNTKTSEFGAEKGLLQGHARRLVAQALKTPNSSRKLSAKHFYREDGGAGGGDQGLVVANILVSDPLFLHSSHKVRETTKTNVIICSDKKVQRSQGWILSSKVQAYSTWDLTIVW